jgi:biopolymer transport protein ExbD
MRATSQSLNSDINVTPLVDVCLVLLIIFMVVLPTMVNGVEVQRLRETAASRPIAVRADKQVPYGDVASVLGECRTAGWTDVALVTTPPPAAQ